MMLWRSFRKSRNLARWSKVLGTPMFSFPFGSPESRAHMEARDKALAEVLAFCKSDPDLSNIMRRHGATRETLAQAYEALLTEGAFAWERGHLVCLSALCFGFTLDYVLSNLAALQSKNATGIVYRLVMYFRNEEAGPVAGG